MKNRTLLKTLVEKHGVFIIAEVGCNHEGDINTAIATVEAAARAGAHAVKFQGFDKSSLFAEKPYCEALNIPLEALAGVDSITFKRDWYGRISKIATANNIIFFSSPFSPEAVSDMEEVDMPFYKVASCDINNIPLLNRLAITHKPVILSTGLATNKEIKSAIKILSKNEVALLHCSVEYPTPRDRVRLNRISILKRLFKQNIVGYSDHTVGVDAAISSVACGAQIVEKHFTFTPEKKTGDHILSLGTDEFLSMSKSILNVHAMLGGKPALKKEKVFSEQEIKEFVYAKRGIYLRREMKKGEKITEQDLIALRPAVGISVSHWNSVVGSELLVDKEAMMPISKKDIKKG